MAGAEEAAGIVLGARAPIVLTNRADGPQARPASCAVAVLFAEAQRKGAVLLKTGVKDIMEQGILVINAGSSSIKFAVFTDGDRPEPALLFKGQMEGLGNVRALGQGRRAGKSTSATNGRAVRR
ncbi:MAG: hypothetical protein R3F40_09515 [Candidatus Competibacteraceae bacterium]